MPLEILFALALFAVVSTITPGLNNMLLLASGANWGVVRTVPHMLGITCGFSLMVILVGIGVMQLFERFPITYVLLSTASVLYLLYLAYKIATSSAPNSDGGGRSQPMSFLQAAMFQWVNPKGWTMALTSISLYAPGRELGAILWVALVFALANLPSVSLWTVLGQQMQRLLSTEKRLRTFNVSMAVLLVASMLPMLVLMLAPVWEGTTLAW
ncbi:LysE family translocator [Ferrimonas pelagia]|uniref:LysE family translocator n=1 Tax=Ferrimonas pelagia TaxID=1177826 RepID=A0ABP9EZ79_9GAMM